MNTFESTKDDFLSMMKEAHEVVLESDRYYVALMDVGSINEKVICVQYPNGELYTENGEQITGSKESIFNGYIQSGAYILKDIKGKNERK